MNFFKKNSYDIVRMFITQIGISIFALIMSTAFSAMDIDKSSAGFIVGKVAISVFSTAFYFILLYMSAWDWGAKDKIRIDAGKLSKNNAKLFLMALIANAPNIVISLVSAFCLIFSACGITKFFYAAGSLLFFLLYFLSHMFYGTTSAIFDFLKNSEPGSNNSFFFLMQLIVFILLYFVTMLVCHLGYSLGVREKRIFGFIKMKPKKYE